MALLVKPNQIKILVNKQVSYGVNYLNKNNYTIVLIDKTE